MFLIGCAHVNSTVSPYPFTTERPVDTVEAHIEAGDPLVDERPILDLPYAPPTRLMLGQSAPSTGVLFSEYDSLRYRLLDESAEAWRIRALTSEWLVARTEWRDAELIEALEERVDVTVGQASRRQRLMWLFLTAGVVVGVGASVGVNRLMH